MYLSYIETVLEFQFDLSFLIRFIQPRLVFMKIYCSKEKFQTLITEEPEKVLL